MLVSSTGHYCALAHPQHEVVASDFITLETGEGSAGGFFSARAFFQFPPSLSLPDSCADSVLLGTFGVCVWGGVLAPPKGLAEEGVLFCEWRLTASSFYVAGGNMA